MPQSIFQANETFEQTRQRMLAETSRFIEWGLAHPDLIPRIPRHRVGHGNFSEAAKAAFWSLVWTRKDLPD